MLTIVSDTHATDDHRLHGRTLEAVRQADLVVHAGDFTTEAVLDAFVAESERFLAVHGNSDTAAVRERLPSARTFEYGGVRFAMTHTRSGGSTGLVMFGRERDANVVVYGHTHRPSVAEGVLTLLNPGSHAQPRGHRPGHAELESVEGGLNGRLCTPEGEVFETFHVEAGEQSEKG